MIPCFPPAARIMRGVILGEPMALRLPSFLCAASAGLIGGEGFELFMHFALRFRFRVGFEEFGFSALAFLGLIALIVQPKLFCQFTNCVD